MFMFCHNFPVTVFVTLILLRLFVLGKEEEENGPICQLVHGLLPVKSKFILLLHSMIL